MLTVLESIKLSEEYLKKKGVEEARVNAELLLAGILDCKRLDLYLKFDQPLSEKEISKYREFIARRGKFEPLQYILGKVEFFGIPLKVNNSVLIPRPETELLVETILEDVEENQSIRVLDIGCGSGNISLALADKLNNPEITGIDISQSAISLAKENAELLGLSGKVEFKQIDIFENVIEKLEWKFDIIVSNPPYVKISDYETLQPEIKDFEPKTAVTDFADGFSFYKRISEIANDLLKGKGKVYFEIAEGQSETVGQILEKNKFLNIKIIKDLSGIDRIIFGELT